MIIVDTSIWIEYFKQNNIYTSDLNLLLNSRLILAIEPIFAELIYGVRSDKEKRIILSFWNILPKEEIEKYPILEAANFANIQNFHNKGVGLIDSMIISAAMKSNCKIWTLDKKILKNIPESFDYSHQSNYKENN
jgi:predicted nucleic acid-binding protein